MSLKKYLLFVTGALILLLGLTVAPVAAKTTPACTPVNKLITKDDDSSSDIANFNFEDDNFFIIFPFITNPHYRRSVTVSADTGYTITEVWLDVENDGHNNFHQYGTTAGTYNPHPGDVIDKAKVRVVRECPEDKVNICHHAGPAQIIAIRVDESAFDGQGQNDHTLHGDFLYGGPVNPNNQQPTSDAWCENNQPGDVCTNIDGKQTTVPANHYQSNGQCLPKTPVCADPAAQQWTPVTEQTYADNSLCTYDMCEWNDQIRADHEDCEPPVEMCEWNDSIPADHEDCDPPVEMCEWNDSIPADHDDCHPPIDPCDEATPSARLVKVDGFDPCDPCNITSTTGSRQLGLFQRFFQVQAAVVDPCDPEPSPEPTPEPKESKKSSLDTSSLSCTNRKFDAKIRLTDNGDGKEGITVKFSYNGETVERKTDDDGEAKVGFNYSANRVLKVEPQGGYKDHAREIVMDEECVDVEYDPGVGGQVLGATTLAPTGVAVDSIMQGFGSLGASLTLAGSLLYARTKRA